MNKNIYYIAVRTGVGTCPYVIKKHYRFKTPALKSEGFVLL